MVVFVDLDADDNESSRLRHHDLGSFQMHSQYHSLNNEEDQGVKEDMLSSEEQNLDLDSLTFSRAVGCYPVSLSLSSHLDLNDLHALSLTSRDIHKSLVQFAPQLVAHSLRCIHDDIPLVADIVASQAAELVLHDNISDSNFVANTSARAAIPYARPQIIAAITQWPRTMEELPHISFGTKIGQCARDLVAPCRKCGTVVCRNCAAKPPSNRRLRDRHRRLCRTCLDAPISAHLQPLTTVSDLCDSPPDSSASSARSIRSGSSSSNRSTLLDIEEEDEINPSFTASAFWRDPCTCNSGGVYLCNPCGQNLNAADVTYKRVWTWRSRYSTHIGGGLGTGLGEGNQGQKCGRGEQCLETGSGGICWVEIDCSEGVSSAMEPMSDYDPTSRSWTGTPSGERQSPETMRNKPGYLRQEIEGIGGVVKKKVKKRVKVGATVTEYDDERESGKYLERESSGQERSWCGWCGRVCLGEKDRAVYEKLYSEMSKRQR